MNPRSAFRRCRARARQRPTAARSYLAGARSGTGWIGRGRRRRVRPVGAASFSARASLDAPSTALFVRRRRQPPTHSHTENHCHSGLALAGPRRCAAGAHAGNPPHAGLSARTRTELASHMSSRHPPPPLTRVRACARTVRSAWLCQLTTSHAGAVSSAAMHDAMNRIDSIRNGLSASALAAALAVPPLHTGVHRAVPRPHGVHGRARTRHLRVLSCAAHVTARAGGWQRVTGVP
jgi:hypothetical protein